MTIDQIRTALTSAGHDPDRFLSKTQLTPNGCLEWHAARGTHGYGVHRHNGKLHLTHRWLYQLLHGPIPNGLELDHLCRNRACVSPTHLEPVTHQENTLRGTSPAAHHATQTACKRGHPFTPDNTYRDSKNKRVCLTCKRHKERLRSYTQHKPRADRGTRLKRNNGTLTANAVQPNGCNAIESP